MQTIGLGLLGFGTVGQGVKRLLNENASEFASHRGLTFHLHAIGVSSLTKAREEAPDLLTDDLSSIVKNPKVAIVVEAIGGLEPARTLALAALDAGKHYVTANKALVATHGPELFESARVKGLGFRFESTVCAGLPVVAALDRQLAANRIDRIRGILNGTTNYILTRMTREGLDFESALVHAQDSGYAEADPTSDVDGEDAAFKISILASIAEARHWPPDRVRRRGIRDVSLEDIRAVAALGGRIKLLAEWSLEGGAKVEPVAVLPPSRFLEIEGTENAVEIVGNGCGPVFFAGAGAGGFQTASGLLGDVVEIGARLAFGPSSPHQWNAIATERPRSVEASRRIVISPTTSPDAFEQIERAIAPLRIERFAQSATDSCALVEKCDAQMLSQALESQRGAEVRQIYRVPE